MKICILSEGCYPHLMGGVSAWIQMLLTSMPEHEFIIYSIGAEKSKRGQYAYELPKNVVQFQEVFIDDYTKYKGKPGKKYRISGETRLEIQNLMCGKQANWELIFDFLKGKQYDNIANFLMSKDFYDIVADAGDKYYSYIGFTELFWTARSMLLPLFQILSNPLPQADLYHSVSTGYAGMVGSMAKYIYKKPYLITEHGIYCREREEEIIRAEWLKGYYKDMFIGFFNGLSKCAYDSADRVVTLFQRNKEIEIEMGCPEDKLQIVPNGVRLEHFQQFRGIENDDGYFNIGALVRVVPIKDIKTMIQGFALAKQDNPALRLYIMGPTDEDEEYYLECVQLVNSLMVPDVIFTGRINPDDYFNKIDAFILTSISEGQPLALLETMACGKPNITTDVGGCRDLLLGDRDLYGETGIVVPVMDYEKLARAMVKLADDKILRNELGANGINKVTNLYSFDLFIEAYKTLYSELGGGK